MNMSSGVLRFFQWICRFSFGNFEKEEFKKFVKMGLIYALIVGVMWTLRPLKDSIFIQLVGKMQLPFAKTISILGLLPLVMVYTKLLGKTSKEKRLIILPFFYGIFILCFSLFMMFVQAPNDELATKPFILILAIKALGYLWYLFVESYSSLVVALFWSFSTGTTEPNHAKRGFPLVYAIGQIGGVILPVSIGGLPYRLGLKTDALAMVCLAFLTFLIIPLVKYFLRSTPENLLSSYSEKQQLEEKEKKEPSFLEGFKILITHRYLLGIFVVNFIFEVVVTIFDFNFKIAAGSHYSGVALSNYLSIYGSSVNIVSLACLILGISNISRFLGIGVSLAVMPIIIGAALFGFMSLDSLSFLFALMVGSKAINYALNRPSYMQLYIPTTEDAKFKAQAWIETFGSRLAKEAGSIFNMSLAPFQSCFGELVGKAHYLMCTGLLCFPLLAFWFIVTIFLGNSYKKAINQKSLIC